LVRYYNRRISIIKRELRRKDVSLTKNKIKILRKRLIMYRTIRSGRNYLVRLQLAIRRYRLIIKRRPNPSILRRIKQVTKRISIVKKYLTSKRIIKLRRALFKKVIVRVRVYQGCVKIQKVIRKSVLRKWNKSLNNYKNRMAKATALQRNVYRRKIIKIRVMKSGQKYINKIIKRLNGYKFAYLKSRKEQIKRKIIACTKRIRIAQKYVKSVEVRRAIRQATKKVCIRRNVQKTVIKPKVA
jgi:peroxiredoxin family protein